MRMVSASVPDESPQVDSDVRHALLAFNTMFQDPEKREYPVQIYTKTASVRAVRELSFILTLN